MQGLEVLMSPWLCNPKVFETDILRALFYFDKMIAGWDNDSSISKSLNKRTQDSTCHNLALISVSIVKKLFWNVCVASLWWSHGDSFWNFNFFFITILIGLYMFQYLASFSSAFSFGPTRKHSVNDSALSTYIMNKGIEQRNVENIKNTSIIHFLTRRSISFFRWNLV